MIQGFVCYVAPIGGREFPRISVQYQNPLIDRVDIEAPHRRPLRIEVRYTSVATADEARACAIVLAREIVDRVAFELGTGVGDPQQEGDAFRPVPGRIATGAPHSVSQSLDMMQGVVPSLAINPAAVARLQGQLQQPPNALPGERFYSIFRSALKADNVVDRFLSLYNIVLLRHNDEQKDVDAFIRTEEPAVAQTRSPMHPKRMETTYTRLRNEFAHVRPGTSFDRTREEMEQHSGGLMVLAKKAIQIP